MSDKDDDIAQRKMQFLFALRSRGVTDAKVLEAMEKIDRGLFVTGHFADRAYEDMPLPIGCGQTISQPSVVGQFHDGLTSLLRVSRLIEVRQNMPQCLDRSNRGRSFDAVVCLLGIGSQLHAGLQQQQLFFFRSSVRQRCNAQ